MNDITHSEWAGCDNEAQEAALVTLLRQELGDLNSARLFASQANLPAIKSRLCLDGEAMRKARIELRALADGSRVSMTREEYEALTGPAWVTDGEARYSVEDAGKMIATLKRLRDAQARDLATLKGDVHIEAMVQMRQELAAANDIIERIEIATTEAVERCRQGSHVPSAALEMVEAVVRGLEAAETALESLKAEHDADLEKLEWHRGAITCARLAINGKEPGDDH